MKKVLLLSLTGVILLSGCTKTKSLIRKLTGQPAPTAMVQASATPAPQAQAMIEISNYKFSPATLTVRPGETVKVVNHDTVRHDVHAKDNSFKTVLLGKDESATFTAPMKAGTYDYICDPHSATMKGVLVVK